MDKMLMYPLVSRIKTDFYLQGKKRLLSRSIGGFRYAFGDDIVATRNVLEREEERQGSRGSFRG